MYSSIISSSFSSVSIQASSMVSGSDAIVGAWLDNDGPPCDELLVCANGILNLPKFAAGAQDALIPHTPRLFVLNRLDFDFNQTAPMPVRWLRFLSEVWPDEPLSHLLL